MSTFFDVFWNRYITSVSDAEESARKEREEERQLMANSLCHDVFTHAMMLKKIMNVSIVSMNMN